MPYSIKKALPLVVLLTTSHVLAAPGLTVFHIGNSLTDETYRMHDIAQGFGYTWSGLVWGRSMIPGSPIHLLWSENVKKTLNSADGNCGFFMETAALGGGESWIADKYPSLWSTTLYLNAKPFDVVVLQIYNSNGDSYWNQWGPGLNSGTIDGVVGFSGDAYQGNADCQIYLYASHTGTEGLIDTSMTNRYIDYIALRDTIAHAFPARKAPLIIPAPLAFNAMIEAGFGDLWVAGDGHANENGRYLLSALFYAIIYRSNPAGAPTSAFTGLGAGYAAKAQEVAWSVATSYPHTGVSLTGTADRPTRADSRSPAQANRRSSVSLSGRALPVDIVGSVMQLTAPGRVDVQGLRPNSPESTP